MGFGLCWILNGREGSSITSDEEEEKRSPTPPPSCFLYSGGGGGSGSDRFDASSSPVTLLSVSTNDNPFDQLAMEKGWDWKGFPLLVGK